MDTPNLPKDAAFRIEHPIFEGPLDLLLHLIKKHELNIIDLPIAFITERYLHYLEMMQELDLDVASEYLVMAATLAHIKSKSLLPPDPREEEEEDEGEDYMEDPRQELIRRLLEYQKYKAAAENLGGRSLPGRDVFLRGTPAPKAQGEAPLAEVSLFKLLDAFEGILKRVRGKVAFEITAERISIQERMTQISELLRERKSCTFEELFESDKTRYDVVVTFLALLEMTKLRLTKLYQADVQAPIHVQYALLDADSPDIPLETTSDVVEKPDWETPPLEEDPGTQTLADDDDDFDDATLEELLSDEDYEDDDADDEDVTATPEPAAESVQEDELAASAEPSVDEDEVAFEESYTPADVRLSAAAREAQAEVEEALSGAADGEPETWGAGQVSWPAEDEMPEPAAMESAQDAQDDQGDAQAATPPDTEDDPSDERRDA